MKKLVILAVALLISGSAYALNSDKFWTESINDLKADLVVKDKGISDVARYQDSACSRPMSVARRNVCIAAYNATIANRRAERAALELQISAKALEMSEPNREFLVQELYPKETLVWLDGTLTSGLFARIWKIFPDPNYKAK